MKITESMKIVAVIMLIAAGFVVVSILEGIAHAAKLH